MSAPNHPRPDESPRAPIDQRAHERLCEYLFGELDEAGRREVEAELERSPELRAERVRLEATVGLVQQALPAEKLSDEVQATLRAVAARGPQRARFRYLRGGSGALAAAAAVVLLVGGLFIMRSTWMDAPHMGQVARAPEESAVEGDKLGDDRWRFERSDLAEARPVERELDEDLGRKNVAKRERAQAEAARGAVARDAFDQPADVELLDELQQLGYEGKGQEIFEEALEQAEPALQAVPETAAGAKLALVEQKKDSYKGAGDTVPPGAVVTAPTPSGPTSPGPAAPSGAAPGKRSYGRYGGRSGEKSDERLKTFAWRDTQALSRRARGEQRFSDDADQDGEARELELLDALGYTSGDPADEDLGGWIELADDQEGQGVGGRRVVLQPEEVEALTDDLLGETRILEGETPADMFFRCWGANPFVLAAQDDQSTFGIDVDTASYTLARRMLNNGLFPTADQIRTEEFVNYFKADQPAPASSPNGGNVFAIGLELAPSRFNADPNVDMLRVTVRGKDVDAFDRQPLALTFVVDVSGSMKDGGRLELVKEGLLMLLSQLSATDSVAVIAFSKETRLVSPMLSTGTRGPIEDAILQLTPDGGTNVEAGLTFGYEIAAAHLTPHAVNRVILFSDGVGNIGETDQNRILEKVAGHRAQGIYLNTFGVGMGNHNETFLEQLANRGDGVCQYIDSAREAERALVQGFTQAMQPIARDVKIQVEFAPAQVESYRLLGYENRAIADHKFRDDKVDAGEVNAGHQVTALYEIVRAPSPGGPIATARVRYKPPFAVDRGALASQAQVEAEKAVEIERSVGTDAIQSSFSGASAGYRRSVLVAQFAELLRRSVHARDDSLDTLLEETTKLEAELRDPDFTEFLGLVKLATPQLKALQASETDELRAMLDRLCELHFQQGQLELLAEEGDEKENEPVAAALRAEIERLEQAVRELLQSRYLPPVDELEGLGYGDEDR